MRELDVSTASELLSVIVGVRKLPAAVSRLAYHALFSAGRVHGGEIVLGNIEKHRDATDQELAQRALCMVRAHDASCAWPCAFVLLRVRVRKKVVTKTLVTGHWHHAPSGR